MYYNIIYDSSLFNVVLNYVQSIRLPERTGYAVGSAHRVTSIPRRLQPA